MGREETVLTGEYMSYNKAKQEEFNEYQWDLSGRHGPLLRQNHTSFTASHTSRDQKPECQSTTKQAELNSDARLIWLLSFPPDLSGLHESGSLGCEPTRGLQVNTSMTKIETEIRDSPIIAQRKKCALHCQRSLHLIMYPFSPHFSAMPSLDWNQAYSDKIILNSEPTSNDLALKPCPSLLISFSKIASMLTKGFKFVLYFFLNYSSPLSSVCRLYVTHQNYILNLFPLCPIFSREGCFSLASERTCQRTAFSGKNNCLICSSRESAIPQKIKFYIIRSYREHSEISLNQDLKQEKKIKKPDFTNFCLILF